MNKDVIYIEPEDDITSIIRKMNNSKNKLVALVPPKRIGVLRSAVNTRLIVKNAKQAGKTVVMVRMLLILHMIILGKNWKASLLIILFLIVLRV